MPLSSVKSGVTVMIRVIKPYGKPSLVLYGNTRKSIQREKDVERTFRREMKSLEGPVRRQKQPQENPTSFFKLHTIGALHSTKEGIFQPWTIILRTALRCLILVARIESLFGHGTHFDFAKWVFRKISFHDLTSAYKKRAGNIGVSFFRISFAPVEILAIFVGSSIGVIFPDVGAKIRRSVYKIDLAFDKKEQENTNDPIRYSLEDDKSTLIETVIENHGPRPEIVDDDSSEVTEVDDGSEDIESNVDACFEDSFSRQNQAIAKEVKELRSIDPEKVRED